MTARALLKASAATLALGAVLTLCACKRPAPFAAADTQAAGAPADPGYRAPPQLRGWDLAGDGSVTLSGRAWPGSKVRMVSPAGVERDAAADGSGAWTLPLGPATAPALYRLAEEANGRRVDAEGLIIVLPGPPVVALLRAGYGAQVQDRGQAGAAKILAVDYDGGGGAVVSGRAAASAPVRVQVDGQPAGDGASGPDGRFSVVLTKPLDPGPHRLLVQTAGGQASAAVPITAPQPPKQGPYQVQAQPYGWRIDWVTASEAPQTTLLLGG